MTYRRPSVRGCRPCRISVNLTPEEAARLADLASARGLGLSAYIRYRLFGRASLDAIPNSQPPEEGKVDT
jgi:hypothetical protein